MRSRNRIILLADFLIPEMTATIQITNPFIHLHTLAKKTHRTAPCIISAMLPGNNYTHLSKIKRQKQNSNDDYNINLQRSTVDFSCSPAADGGGERWDIASRPLFPTYVMRIGVPLSLLIPVLVVIWGYRTNEYFINLSERG